MTRVPQSSLHGLREFLSAREAEMEVALAELVQAESPSDNSALLAHAADLLERRFVGLVDRVDRHEAGTGVILRFTMAGTERVAAPVLVMGHYDTVFPAGILSTMPLRITAEAIHGPGAFDAKGGIVVLEFALRALSALGLRPAAPVVALLTPDEEVGSGSSRDLVQAEARLAASAFILEPALPGGAVKTSRKGVMRVRMTVTGKAAHAGLDPERGASAVRELAAQILAAYDLEDHAAGTTINVGTVHGGTRANVVADRAVAELDVRCASSNEAGRVRAAFRRLRSLLPNTEIELKIVGDRPPMERSEAAARLFAHASSLAATLGLALAEGPAGGASDGNLTAALGTPTLDGLGPDGDGAHSPREHVRRASLAERAALLAGLLAEPLPGDVVARFDRRAVVAEHLPAAPDPAAPTEALY